MKNYLKKAISAVIALALACSIIPASFAAGVVLTDVPETADYATAVNALVALKVVNGYEDNTFLPDNKITRAEASKIIVAALNETASAEAMKGATKFSDVLAKHDWATGYINKGVSLGYIQGDNGKFDPDGNVTYAQIVKMLVCAMGYEDYAASLAEQYNYTGANWYVPFTQLGDDAGVTAGVSVAPNEAVTRAQVAQLVYNAVQAPIVKNTGISYTDSGKIVPKIEIQDGAQSDYFKSILTEKFDAFYVEGYVTETQKDNTGLKADEVKFAIAKTKKYDNDDVCILKDGKVDNVNTLAEANADGRILTKVNVGDTAAADFKGTYATAIVVLDEYDDWSFLNLVPSGRNKTTTFDLKDLDDAEDGYALVGKAPYLKFFVDGAKVSTKYLLDPKGVSVYVNGVKVEDTVENVGTEEEPEYVVTEYAVKKYVIDGEIGDVELVDTYKTDGKIDTIYVNKYLSGMFDGITSAGKISFKSPDAGLTYIVLDDEDESLEYNIYYNGEAITVDDLKKDDVLTIAYDPTVSARDSKFYEIYVSRDTVTDTLKGRDNDEKAAKFGDKYYPFASNAKYTAFASAKLGDEYTLYLDAFGRIFKADQNTSAANWAIVKKFTKADIDDDYKLTLFTADGTEKAYYFDATSASVTLANGKVMTTGAADEADWDEDENVTEKITDANLITAINNQIGDKTDITKLVIQYKVKSSSGKINDVKLMGAKDSTTDKEEYSERRNAIGTLKLGDVTKIIDATKFAKKELATATYADLTNETKYKAYAYGSKIDGIFPFVVITEGEAAYTAATRFAVLTEDGYAEETDEETGDIIFRIKAMYGEAESLVVTDDVTISELDGLKKGEVIVFETNSKGQVRKIDKLMTWADSIPTQAALAAGSLVDNYDAEEGETTYANLTALSISNFAGGSFSEDFTPNWEDDSKDAIKVVYGPVIQRTDKDIAFGKIVGGKTNIDTGVSVFEYSDDIRVYTYDYAQGKDRFDYLDKATSAIFATSLLETNMDDEVTVDWNKDTDSDVDGVQKGNQEAVTFAFAIVVNDEVQDIFAFLAK